MLSSQGASKVKSIGLGYCYPKKRRLIFLYSAVHGMNVFVTGARKTVNVIADSPDTEPRAELSTDEHKMHTCPAYSFSSLSGPLKDGVSQGLGMLCT